MKPYYSDYSAYMIRRALSGKGREEARDAVEASLSTFDKETEEILRYVYRVSPVTQEGVRMACKVYHIYSEGRLWKSIKILERTVARNLEILDD